MWFGISVGDLPVDFLVDILVDCFSVSNSVDCFSVNNSVDCFSVGNLVDCFLVGNSVSNSVDILVDFSLLP